VFGSPVISSAILIFALSAAAASGYCLLGWLQTQTSRLSGLPIVQRIATTVLRAHAPARLVVANAIITWVKILFSGLAYWVIFRALLEQAPSLLTTTVVTQSAGLVAYVPVSFNGLGTVEISAITLFKTIGVDGAVILSAYLILRIVTMLCAWLPAAVTLALPSHPVRH
jgi:uncharacterized membrane protein YbhN (UPF0104 family)